MSVAGVLSYLMGGYMPSILLATTAVILICYQRLSPNIDPQEPPVLKPKVPIIGHIIGLLTKQIVYFDELSANNPLPKGIATLPMLAGKTYLITSPALVQSAFKNKSLSFEPFMVDFAQKMLGISDEGMLPFRATSVDGMPTFMDAIIKAIHTSMLGEHLHKMNADALNHVADSINEIGEETSVDSLYLWLRQTLTMATTSALLGSHNPMIKDPSLVDALWDFEADIMKLVMNVYPSITAPAGYKGRERLQAELIKYYTARHDLEPDVAMMTKARAATFRDNGLSDTDVGRLELALLHVATTNAIPTLFWNLAFITSDSALLAKVRAELLSIISLSGAKGKREAVIDITKFETNCPLLVSSYRETIRLANAQLGSRRAMADTTISDGTNSYLIRKGCDVQMPAGVPHLASKIWGPTAGSFDATRFLKPEDRGLKSTKEKEDDKEQKKAYFPFGGGKHLCPGRNFAFAEILGMIAIMSLGFDVKGADGEILKVPVMERPRLGEGVAKPRGEGLKLGAKIVRRQGWEDIAWKFTC